MIHTYGSSYKIFNWFTRELWCFGFRKLFAIDNEHAELQVAGDLSRVDYITIHGKSDKRVVLAIYIYIP